MSIFRRKKKKHKHTWGPWRNVPGTAYTLRNGTPYDVTAQSRQCTDETCLYREVEDL
jgi:hypothetical protein